MDPIEPSTLCILRPDGKIVGTGFLVSKTLAVTCAHVVASIALDAENRLRVRFTGQEHSLLAKVLDDFLDIERDVAILELESVPANLKPLRLAPAKACRPGSAFRSFGYTTAADVQGIHANGSIDGYLPEHRLLQLQSPQANHGISGGPVFDESRNVVVGMITKGHTELGRNEQTTFATPTESLFEIYPAIRPSETCPYQELKTFTDETAGFFFGREILTQKLLGVLRSGNRFLAVLGPSGSGKSSLIRAGLLPALKKDPVLDGQKWAQLIIRPEDDPFGQMKAAGLESLDAGQILQSQPGMERVLLFVDQFEELFTICPKDLRERFVRQLIDALKNSRLTVIVSMRNEFYSEFTAKAESLANSEYLKIENVPGTLNPDELTAIIEQPAEMVGLALEEGLTERILSDVMAEGDGEARSSILPLLEFALTKLWDQRRDGWLTHEAYDAIEGVTGSLALWARKAFEELSPENQVVSKSLLTSLVHLGDKAQALPDTRRRREYNEVGYSEAARRVINHFADRRLIISGETVELVHDALVRVWPGLQDWLGKDRENLRIKEGVEQAARQWAVDDRKDESLLTHRGTRLQRAVEISNDPEYHFSETEKKYLKACVEFEIQEKKKVRRLKIGVFASSLVLLIVFGILAWAFLTKERAVPGQWVTIPAGSFTMGMDEEEVALADSLCREWALDKNSCPLLSALPLDSGLQKDARLPEFSIMDNEVTNAQYQQCGAAGVCQPPKDWLFDKNKLNLPATNLNWFQAEAYCEWLGGRLPTEGEWEKATRGPNNLVFPWGNTWEDEKANLEQTGIGNVVSVLQYAESDVSGYGVKNLAGNVSEWTTSELLSAEELNYQFSNKVFIPTIDKPDMQDDLCVPPPAGFCNPVPVIVRGGNWLQVRSEGMNAMRSSDGVLMRRETLGFRCVCPDGKSCASPWDWKWIWFGK